jgi:TolB protein
MRRSTLAAVVATAAAGLAAPPAHATFPGQNGRISFQRDTGRQADLLTVRPDGTGVRRLTRTRTWEEHAEWSADGRRLAYARSAPDGEPADIWTMDADGGDRRAVTAFGSVSLAPTWSPTGSIAYFSLKDFPAPGPDDPPPPAELYATDPDGTTRRLTRDRRIQTDATFSPDGSTLAYSQWKAVKGQPGVFDIGISLMDADGTDRRALLAANGRRDAVTQSFSPDGTRIVFELVTARPPGRRRGERQSDLAIVNVDGSGMRRLTRTAALETTPVWSPDGTRIAFASDRHAKGRDLQRHGPASEIYTMRADGGDVQRLTHNTVPDSRPDWQPLPAPTP